MPITIYRLHLYLCTHSKYRFYTFKITLTINYIPQTYNANNEKLIIVATLIANEINDTFINDQTKQTNKLHQIRNRENVIKMESKSNGK